MADQQGAEPMQSHPGPGGVNARVSEDPRDYASLVLYYATSSDPALRVREMLLPFGGDVIFQDASDIPPERRPPWLRGVPTLVELPSYRVHAGSAALQHAERWLATQVRSLECAAGSCSAATRLSAAPLELAFGEVPVEDEGRYRDGKSEEHTSGRTLEDLMRSRQQRSMQQQQ